MAAGADRGIHNHLAGKRIEKCQNRLGQDGDGQDRERVRITIQAATSWVDETYGICGWKGSPEEAERFATDPELDFPPPPEEP